MTPQALLPHLLLSALPAPDVVLLDAVFAWATQGAQGPAAEAEAVRTLVRDLAIHDRGGAPVDDLTGEDLASPLEALLRRRGWCNLKSRLVIDIMWSGGYRGRVVQAHIHQGAEVRWNGRWHLVDPYMDPVPGSDGDPASVWGLCRDPWTADQTPHEFTIPPSQVFCPNPSPRYYRGAEGAWAQWATAPAPFRP